METDNAELIRLQEVASIGKSIKLSPVTSSNIGGIGYDADHKLLKVAFKNKDSYTYYLYENVEKEQYDAIISAQSVGKMLSESIIKNKEKHKYIKL